MGKKIIFTTVTIGIFYLLFELLCFGGERYLARKKNMQYSPPLQPLLSRIASNRQNIEDVIADTIKPKRWYFDADVGWGNADYKTPWEIITNKIRDDKRYDSNKPPDVLRMLAFGDSFVYGAGVSNRSTWTRYMSNTGNLEVLNFGVPGYGLDQAYLLYLKEGRKYQTDYVLICFMTENINRDVNTFRVFYVPDEPRFFSKPRFVDDYGKLKLVPSYFQKPEEMRQLIQDPVKTLAVMGKEDYFYKTRFYFKGAFDKLPSVRLFKILAAAYREQLTGAVKGGVYNTSSEAYRVTEMIFDAFVADVVKTGAVPVIVVFPDTDDLERERQQKPKKYEALLKHFREKKYRFVDMMDAFDKYCPQCPLDQLIACHYSPIGNFFVANELVGYFLKRKINPSEFSPDQFLSQQD